jgi:hypothetical protein
LRNLQPFQSNRKKKLAENKSSTPGKKALENPSSAISKQQEKKIDENNYSKKPTRKRYERNGKKNPWTNSHPNYNFGKSILRATELNVVAPCNRDVHTFFMERCRSQDESPITVALRPGTGWWLMKVELANKV